MEHFYYVSAWFVSGGLFLGVGYLYDRYKSRNLLYYRFSKCNALYTLVSYF